MLVATRLPLKDWAPVKRKQSPAESLLFGPPVPQPGVANGLPADFDHTSYRCSAVHFPCQHGQV